MKSIQEVIKKTTGYNLNSPEKIYMSAHELNVGRWFWLLLLFLILLLFMPWTQNIKSNGTVTTLYQDQRPQELNSIIPGRIIKWWVKEGDFVNKGDTIVQLLDIKDEYLDPDLMERTTEQLNAKEQKIGFYKEKISATESQLNALNEGRELKLKSLENKLDQINRKLISDSGEVVSAKIENEIALQQLGRAKKMYEEGIIALTELEKRNQLFNKTLAGLTEKQQKFLNTRQDLVICRIEMNTIKQDAADKIFKAKGEIASAQSEMASTSGELSKNKNQLANYKIRGSQRWLIAPQSGQIAKAQKSGINEIVKDGEMIVEIIPSNINFAVELFIEPMDLALIGKGQKIRLIFDGFPAIVFSGWPMASYGTFEGEILAVETNRSDNGKFRILVTPSLSERQWPSNLKIGTGVQGLALLKNVTIGYELWRQINGFPPEYYKVELKGKKESSKK